MITFCIVNSGLHELVRLVTIIPMKIHIEHSKLIDRIGGTSKVAALCKVRSQAVSRWRRDGIPPARMMFLEVAHPEAMSSFADNKKKI